jgi:hypothetical protein
MGNCELAASFAAQTADSAKAAYIGAVAAPDPRHRAHRLCWRLPQHPWHGQHYQEQTRRAFYELAAVGQLTRADIPIAENRGATPMGAIVVLTARHGAANGQVAPAVAALRELRHAYSPATEFLIEVLDGAARTVQVGPVDLRQRAFRGARSRDPAARD